MPHYDKNISPSIKDIDKLADIHNNLDKNKKLRPEDVLYKTGDLDPASLINIKQSKWVNDAFTDNRFTDVIDGYQAVFQPSPMPKTAYPSFEALNNFTVGDLKVAINDIINELKSIDDSTKLVPSLDDLRTMSDKEYQATINKFDELERLNNAFEQILDDPKYIAFFDEMSKDIQNKMYGDNNHEVLRNVKTKYVEPTEETIPDDCYTDFGDLIVDLRAHALTHGGKIVPADRPWELRLGYICTGTDKTWSIKIADVKKYIGTLETEGFGEEADIIRRMLMTQEGKQSFVDVINQGVMFSDICPQCGQIHL